jgi:hypothetical protein
VSFQVLNFFFLNYLFVIIDIVPHISMQVHAIPCKSVQVIVIILITNDYADSFTSRGRHCGDVAPSPIIYYQPITYATQAIIRVDRSPGIILKC